MSNNNEFDRFTTSDRNTDDLTVATVATPALPSETLPTNDAAGAIRMAQAGGATQNDASPQVVVELAEGNIARLPEGADISQPRQNGADLEFVQPDGTVIVIPNGAVQGLTLFIGTVEIPPQTVAQLFTANGIEAAAGPDAGQAAQGSHGNFQDVNGGQGVGDGLNYSALLGNTDLSFGGADAQTDVGNLAPLLDLEIIAAELSEDGLPNGLVDSGESSATTLSGTIVAHDIDPLTYSFSIPAGTWTSHGETIVWTKSLVGGVDTLTGTADGKVVFVATISTNGSNNGVYNVTLSGPIDHPLGQGENTLTLPLVVTVTDTFGATAQATLNITIDDDIPAVPAPLSVSVDEHGLVVGPQQGGEGREGGEGQESTAVAHGNLNLAFGADGPAANAAVVLSADGATWTQGTNVTGVLAANDGSWTLEVGANGAYTFTLLKPLAHTGEGNGEAIALNIAVTVTDYDGDSQSAAFTVTVNDDVPPDVGENATILLDDDALSGNPGGVGDGPDGENATGVLAHDYGADGAGSTLLTGATVPQGFTTAVDPSGLILVISQGGVAVLQVTLTDASSGQYTVTQLAPINHPAGGNENDVSFTVTYKVTDSDGDSKPGSVGIVVNDDTPVVSLSVVGSVTADESLLLQNDDILLSTLFVGVHHKGSDPDVLGLPVAYARSAGPVVSPMVSFGADGAAASGSLVYSLNLGEGSNSSGLFTTEGKEIFLFKEGNLIVGRFDGSDGNSTVTNTGTDPAAFAIAIGADGKITLVQYVSLNNPNTNDPDDAVSIALGKVLATVTVTDGDGDVAQASVDISSAIRFEDDGPTVVAAYNTKFHLRSDETAGTQGDETSALSVFSGVTNVGHDPQTGGAALAYARSAGSPLTTVIELYGTDGQAASGARVYSLAISADGVSSGLFTTEGKEIFLHLEANGLVVGRVATGEAAFALAIDSASGKVSSVLYLSLHHNDPNNPDDSLSIAQGAVRAVLTLTDGDGDKASASVDLGSHIEFRDSAPTLAPIADQTVSELTQNGNSNAFIATTLSHVPLNIDFGADGPNANSLAFTTPTGNSGLTSNGQAISYSISGTTLTASAGNRTVFTVTLESDGSYTFKLLDNLDHKGASSETLQLAFGFRAVDGDGDFVDGTFKINVTDSVPTIGTTEVETVSEVDLPFLFDELNPDGAHSLVQPGKLNIDWNADDNNSGAANRSVTFAAGFNAPGDLTSDGQPVVYAYNAEGTVLTATAGGHVVFTVTLDDSGTGTYTFRLYGNIDHAVGTDAKALSFDFVATDSDGDTASSSFTVNVLDDVPTIGDIGTRYVEEEALPGGNEDAQPLGVEAVGVIANLGPITDKIGTSLHINWGNDGGNSNINGGYTGTQIMGDRSVVFATGSGADRVLTANEVSALLSISGGNGAVSTLTSGGTALTYTLSANGSVLTASADGHDVFKVTLSDQSTGAYVFELLGTLDHPVKASGAANEDVLSLRFNFTARDGDGDAATGNFRVVVIDDSPVAGAVATQSVTETTASGNSNAFITQSLSDVSLNISWGADNANNGGTFDRSVAFTTTAAPTGLTSNGEAIFYSISGTTLTAATAGGRAVFTVELSDLNNGSYTFKLLDNLDHKGINGTNLPLTFGFVAKDSDGDSATGSFTVNVKDSVPEPTASTGQTGTLSESSLPVVSYTSGNLNVDINADDKNTHVEIATDGNGHPLAPAGLTSDGVALDYIVRTTNGVDQELVAYKHGDSPDNPVFIVAVLHPAGYAATLYQNLDHPQGNGPLGLEFTARVFDGDGDYVDQKFTINVNDTSPTVSGGDRDFTLDEDDLKPAGNDANFPDTNQHDQTVLAGKSLGIQWGADDGAARDVVIFGIDFAGAALTSHGQPLHFVSLDGSHVLEARDPSDNVVFRVTVDPTAPNGSYTFELLGSLDHPGGSGENSLALKFDFRATDGDGDFVDSSFTIRVTDDIPFAGPVAGASVDENDIAASLHNSLGVQFGADGAAGIATGPGAATAHPVTIDFQNGTNVPPGFTVREFWEVRSGGFLSGANTVPVVIKSTDGHAFDLTSVKLGMWGTSTNGFVVRVQGLDQNGNPIPNAFVNVTITSLADGQPTFTFNAAGTALDGVDVYGLKFTTVGNYSGSFFVDDLKVASQYSDTTVVTGGPVVFADLAHAISATDSQGNAFDLANLRSEGQAVHFALLDAMTLVAYTGPTAPTSITGANVVFSVVLSADSANPNGAYDFKLLQPLDDVNGAVNVDGIKFDFNFVAKDGDGDTTEGHFQIDVRDSVPTISGGDRDFTLDEDDLKPTGNDAHFPDTHQHDQTVLAGKSLGIQWGGDDGAARDVTLTTTSAPGGLTANGLPIHYVVSADGHVLEAVDANDAVIFRVTLDPTAPNGAYTFELLGNLDHPTGNGENSLALDFQFTARDSDGDEVNSSFTIRVTDDIPVFAQPNANLNLLTNGDFSIGAWPHQEGYGAWTTEDIGWKISGTGTIQVERVHDGYLGMHSSTGGQMVDLGSTAGNITLSQTIEGLSATKPYTLSFEIGSPDPSSSALNVYWNGQLVIHYLPGTTMETITISGLLGDANGRGVLTFEEAGTPDNTGTYLANVNLAPGDTETAPLFTGSIAEDAGNAIFYVTEGADFFFGADSKNGTVSFDVADAVYSTPTGTKISISSIEYDPATGKVTVVPGIGFNGLSGGEIATVTIPFTITDGDGDKTTGYYQLTVTGADDAMYTSAAYPDAGSITEYAETNPLANSLVDRTEFDAPAGHAGENGGAFYLFDDQGDTHTLNITSPAGALGYLTAAVTEETANDGVGLVTWNYHVTDNALNPLQAGEQKVETFVITVLDDHGNQTTRTITVTLVGTNDTPVVTLAQGSADNFVFTETDAGQTASGALSVEDPDVKDVVTAWISGASGLGPHGSLSALDFFNYLSLGGPDPVTVIDGTHTSGTINWTFNSGSEAFNHLQTGESLKLVYTVQVKDGHGGIVNHDLIFVINGTNDAPVFGWGETDAPLYETPDQTGSAEVLAKWGQLNVSDADAGDVLTVSVQNISTDNPGGLFLGSFGAWFNGGTTGRIDWVLQATDSSLDFLKEGQTITQVYRVTVTDSQGVSTYQDVTAKIIGSNDAPILDLDSQQSGFGVLANATEGMPQQFAWAATISDVDSDTLASLKVSLSATPDGNQEGFSLSTAANALVVSNNLTLTNVNGVLTITGSASLADYQTILRGVVYLNSDATPDTTPRIVTVSINDGYDTTTQTGTINVIPVNTPPVVTGDLLADVTANQAYQLTTTDLFFVDPDDTSVTFLIQGLTGGKFYVGGAPSESFTSDQLTAGQVTFVADGSVAKIEFQVRAEDANEDLGPNIWSPFTINVTPDNHAPVAVEDAYSVNEDQTLQGQSVLLNDQDGDGDQLTAALVSGPQHGTLTFNANGTFTYTPVANYAGTDSFTYMANDGHANSAPVNVTLTVAPVDDGDATVSISGTAAVGQLLTANFGNDDPDGPASNVSYQWTRGGQPINGATGSTYTVVGGDAGYQIGVQVNYNDGQGFAESISSQVVSIPQVLPPAVVDNVESGGFYAFINDGTLPNALNFDLASLFSGATGAISYSLTQLYSTGSHSDSWIQLNGSVVTGNPGANDDGLYMYKVTATDTSGHETSTYIAFSALTGQPYTITNNGNGNSSGLGWMNSNAIGGDAITLDHSLNAILDAGNGQDVVIGSTANETFRGGTGDDNIYGYGGNDYLYGEDGNDFINGGAGDDRIWGGTGHDILIGGSGNDFLYGEDGDDILVGGSGNDFLDGGTGNDILIGGLGKDTLTGGFGADTFVFSHDGAANADIITDYVVGQGDTIDLQDLLNGYFNGADANKYVSLTASGGNAVLSVDITGTGSFTGHEVATLNGVGSGGDVTIIIEGQAHTFKVV